MIRAEHISKRYAAHEALRDVSVTLKPGQILGLLGPNGAGKTTLIRILNQIIGPDEGQLWYGNEPLKPEHTRHIGYLPEERGLYKKMKVGEQALYLAALKGLSEKEAKQNLQLWFEKFELTGWWNKKIEELSKGMAQKVQFICTLIHDPDIIILDEPFSGFDPVNAELIKGEILDLRKRGKSILLSTHRMESVEALCDDISLIHESRVYLSGSVADLQQQHKQHVWAFQLSEESVSVPQHLAQPLEKRATPHGWLHLYQLEAGQTPKPLVEFLLQQYQLQGFHEMLPSMSDIFIQTVSNKTR